MTRLPRIVIPETPHHVTQRGNRRLPIFFSDDDRWEYLRLIAEAAISAGTSCLARCLMDNHVHLILTPKSEDGLRGTLGEAHRRYTRRVNFREGWRGHLFQGRFASYPMDDAHLMAAVRYVENNPVGARMVARAEDYRWSSARSHIAGERVEGDPLTDIEALRDVVSNWAAILRHGLDAGYLSQAGEDVAEAIEARLRTGRPLAAEDWVARQETLFGRRLRPGKPGPKPRAQKVVA